MIHTLVYVIKGVVMGLSIAAPIGPIGLICIHRTLAGGRIRGTISGLGVATSDMICGIIAGFGMSSLPEGMSKYQTPIVIGGGLFLCYLGLRIVRSQPIAVSQTVSTGSSDTLWRAYGSMLLLTLFNPMTWMTMTGGIAGWGAGAWVHGRAVSLLFVTGVFIGSAIWWVLLSFVISKLKGYISPLAMKGINWVSGLIIVAFGLWGLYEVFI